VVRRRPGLVDWVVYRAARAEPALWRTIRWWPKSAE
jgi:hypothetical protein